MKVQVKLILLALVFILTFLAVYANYIYNGSSKLFSLNLSLLPAASLLILILFLMRWVNSPLKLLSSALRKEDLSLIEELKKERTEFGDIAKLVSASFQQRKELLKSVVERMHAEKVLQKALARAELLYAVVPSAIFTVDLEKRITSWNKTSQALTGYTTEEILGKECYLFSESPCKEKCGLYAQDVVKPIFAKECVTKTKDGRSLSIIKNVDELRDEKGNVIGGIESFEDITERKSTEVALKESERRYRLLAENISDSIWTMDLEMRFTYVSPSIERLLGYTVEEIKQKTLKDILSPLSFSAALRAFAEELELEKKQDKGLYRIRNLELRHNHKDGSSVWAEIRVTFLRDENNKATGILGVSRDLSERKKADKALRDSEFKYHTTIDAMQEAVSVVDTDLKIVLANATLEQWNKDLGLETDVVGKSILKVTPFPPLALVDDYKKVFETKQTLLTQERTLVNGKELITETKKIPVVEGEKVTRVLTLIRNITELEKTKEALERAQQELIQSEKLSALGRFSSGIAHEVKNPLGIILGGIEFLERMLISADKDIKIALSKMKDSTLRATNILQGLLKFARPSELKTEMIRPETLIEDTISLLKYRAPLNNIKIETDFLKGNLFVRVDKNQMQQVIFNVLINAVEAMPEGGQVTVKTDLQISRTDASGRAHCVIEVRDTGSGIAKEDLRKIFEPFFTTKRDTKGTGLGLSMSKMIIEKHNGELKIESEAGRGTSVKIIIPAEQK